MYNINRPIVKQQARDLIKGKVFQLFVIILIVTLLSGANTGFNLNFNFSHSNLDNLFGNDNYYNYNYSDEDYYNNYNQDDDYGDFGFDEFYEGQQSGEVNPFDSFGAIEDTENDSFLDDIFGSGNRTSFLLAGMSFVMILAIIGIIIRIIFAPLGVTLTGILVSFVRRNPAERFELGKEFGRLFKDSFNKSFSNKLGLAVLRGLITGLLSLLFIIPGIVYYYSTYFAYQLMCDNPDLSPSEALAISKKMTKGHKGELFVLNLSFFPWWLLTCITLGLASIYVLPYIQVTDALYYENFRIRALQNGDIAQHEVMSREAMNEQAQNNYFTGNSYNNSFSNQYSDGYETQSYNYNNENYNPPQQGNYFSSPQSNNGGTNIGEYYQPPTDYNDNWENNNGNSNF